jgi:ATP-dependent Clp protease protease subunit
LDFFSRLSRRQIFWNEEVDDGIVDFGMQIIKWNQEDKDMPIEQRKPIRIYINSDGGSLNAIMNFIDVIKLSKTPIYTIAMGRAYSAGGLLLMGGHQGKRFVFNNTTILIHDGSSGAMGDTGKVIDNLKFTEKQEERVKKYILSNTKITQKLYEKNYRSDWWLFSEECIELGIADFIVTDLEQIM